ncbi:MAG: T9SS type A sorting domain-containing protein [Ignavibacteriales bacterium]
MKLRYLLVFLLLTSASTFAQKVYPLVTIRDLQYRPDDSLKAGSQFSSYNTVKGQKDTTFVRIRGIAMNSTLKDPNDPASKAFIYSGTRYSIYIQDSSAKEWGGMVIIQNDQDQGTMLNAADSAQYIEFTGYVSEYNTTTQFNLISKPVPVQISTFGQLPKRPAPLELKISDFEDNGVINPLAEKYEGMYVVFRNVTVTDKNNNDGTFTISDDKGNKIYMYDQSGYFSLRSSNKFPDYNGYKVPENGSKLEYIRGMIQDWWGSTKKGYHISPLYPGDIKVASMPPTITSIRRNTDLVGLNQSVDITSKITAQPGGNVTEAKVYYRVNGSAYSNVAMSKTTDTTVFKGTIPGVKDSAVVDYFIWAKDNLGQTTISPIDTAKGNYLYLVLNRPVTIRDVQYSPLGGGYSPFSGYKVTLTGIVTADTTDIPGDGGTYLEMKRVFMQDGSSPWSGIWVFGGSNVYKLKAGDKITVSGTIIENYSLTRIDSITTLNVLSSNNTLPAPVELSTSDIATKSNGTLDAEKYESMLVKYKNVSVVKVNADDNTIYNDGELLVADQSGVGTRVELQDGAGTYHNSWDTTIVKTPGWTKVSKGDKFTSITGILIYSDGNYKIVPRKNADYVGFTTGVEAVSDKIPSSYSLKQNYPNPFNPSTVIEYSIPEGGMVSLKIFNLLGQEVQTLVNQFQNGGAYKATFNASGMPSGIYFYQLNSGNFNTVKKMLLVK